jgi:hypothetical protein
VVPEPDRNSEHCHARRLTPIEAVMTLTRLQRIEGWKSADYLRAHFASITRVASSVPVLAMRVPWGPPFHSDLVTEVLDAAIPAMVGRP